MPLWMKLSALSAMVGLAGVGMVSSARMARDVFGNDMDCECFYIR
jgi:hypothetical protein